MRRLVRLSSLVLLGRFAWQHRDRIRDTASRLRPAGTPDAARAGR